MPKAVPHIPPSDGPDPTNDTTNDTTKGGGVPSFPGDPNAYQPADVESAILRTLQEWGIPLTPQIRQIIEQAKASAPTTDNPDGTPGWSTDKWTMALRDTRAYQNAFEGKPSWMTEESYLSSNYKGDGEKDMLQTIRDWGIQLTPDLRELAKTASEQAWGTNKITTALRQTKDYQQRFAGRPADMSETTYLSTEQAYHTAAEVMGINLGEGADGPLGQPRPNQGWRIKYLFQNNTSPEEFQAKGEAMVQIRDNPALFQQFTANLSQGGVIKGAVTQENLLRFVMGQGEAQWHEIWQNTIADYAAVNAGITISKGSGLSSLTREQIAAVADKAQAGGLTAGDLQTGFNNVADQMTNIMPLSEASKYGVTKQDFIQAQFGGPTAAESRRKIAAAKAQADAYSQQRVKQGIREGQDGGITAVGGPSQRAQSI